MAHFLFQNSAFGHDSVEDSRGALYLYDRYLELKNGPEPSAWNSFLQQLYDVGRNKNWDK
jgi:hypothetical protein